MISAQLTTAIREPAPRQKIGEPEEFSSPKAIEAISLSKNLSARISLPTKTEDPEEEFIRSGEHTTAPSTETATPTAELWAERWLDLPDGRMRYLKAGSGPALAPHATVYAIDNLGAGLSPAKAGLDSRLRPTAERLLQFVDRLGIGHFDLLGTSHGGGVAIMTAAICSRREI